MKLSKTLEEKAKIIKRNELGTTATKKQLEKLEEYFETVEKKVLFSQERKENKFSVCLMENADFRNRKFDRIQGGR